MKNAPVLWPNLAFLYAAYCELSTCRPAGFGATPIPWTAVIRYADEADMAGQDRSDFLYFMRAMDRSFMEYSEKKTDRDKAASKVKARNKIGGKH